MNRSTEFTDFRRLIACAIMLEKPHGNIRRWRGAKVKFLVKRRMHIVTILSSMESLYYYRITLYSVS